LRYSRQRRLEHVSGVDRPLGLARADHGVQLVDEDDDVAGLRDLFQHRLQPLLELPAVLRPGEQRRHVERQHAAVPERLGNLAVDDALRQSLDDGGLADPGLADEHGVVLGPALQDLDHAADLVVAPDHRVELAGPGPLGQVQRVLLQRLAGPLGFGVRNRLAAAQRVDRLLDRAPRAAGLLEEPPGLALVVGQGEHEELRRDVLVAALLRFLVGDVEQVRELAGDLDVAAVTLDLRQVVDDALQALPQFGDVDPGLGEEGRRAAVVLVEQRGKDVRRRDVLVVGADRNALCVGQRLLELGRQAVAAHGASSSVVEVDWQMRTNAGFFKPPRELVRRTRPPGRYIRRRPHASGR
jgi:hypothetical protein